MYFAVIMIVGGLLGGLIADNKGRNVLGWTLVCGIVPLLILVLCVLPALPKAGISRACPHCLRIIPLQADTCAWCRRQVDPPTESICPGCGRILPPHESFCSTCGAPKP